VRTLTILADFAATPAGTGRALQFRMASDDSGIDERSFRLHVDVLAFLDGVPVRPATKKLIEQLAAAAGSIGGNREEALAASSRREFIRFNEVALRGARETARWLRVFAARRLGTPSECARLLDEARQLARILGRIVVTSKRNDSSGRDT
jgi:four helix bundle protein